MKSILFALIVSCAVAGAGEPIFGQGNQSTKQIDCGAAATFAIVGVPDSGKLAWELSWQAGKTSRSRRSGPVINPNERYVYMAFPALRTVWIATSQTVSSVTLGEVGAQSAIYPAKNYEQIPAIPGGFKKAIADLLAGQ